jgi:hydroxymethylpyrimidine/phosphomethylpyrimidine kinase
MRTISVIKITKMNKKVVQKFRTANTIVVDEQVFVNSKHLSTEHKVGNCTIQKQLNAVNEVFQLEAIKIGNSMFYNKREADLVVTTFKRDYATIVDECLDKLVSTMPKHE